MSRLVIFFLPLTAFILMVFYGQSNYSQFHFLTLLGAIPYLLIFVRKRPEFSQTYINNLGFYLSASFLFLFVVLNSIYLKNLFLRSDKLSGSGYLFYLFIAILPFINFDNSSLKNCFFRPLFLAILLFLLGGRINFMVFILAVLCALPRISLFWLVFFGGVAFVSMFALYWLRDGILTLSIFDLEYFHTLVLDRYKFYSVFLDDFNFNFTYHFLYPFFSFILEGEVIKYALLINREYFDFDHGVHLGVPFGLFVSSNNSFLYCFLGSIGYLLFFWIWFLFVRRYISPFGLSFIAISFMFGFSISVFKLKYTFVAMISFGLYVAIRRLFLIAKN